MPDCYIIEPSNTIIGIMGKLKSVSQQELVDDDNLKDDFRYLAMMLKGFTLAHGQVAIFHVNKKRNKFPLDNHSNILDDGLKLDLTDFKSLLKTWTGLNWKSWRDDYDLVDDTIPNSARTREEVIFNGLKLLTETGNSRNRRVARRWSKEILYGKIPGGFLEEVGKRILDLVEVEDDYDVGQVDAIVKILSGKNIKDLSESLSDQRDFRMLAEVLLKSLKSQELGPEHLEKMSNESLVTKFLERCIDLKKLSNGNFLFNTILIRAAKLFEAFEIGLIGGSFKSRKLRYGNTRLANLFRKIMIYHGRVTFLKSALQANPSKLILSGDEVCGCWVENKTSNKRFIDGIHIGALGEIHTWCSDKLAEIGGAGYKVDQYAIFNELALSEEEIRLFASD